MSGMSSIPFRARDLAHVAHSAARERGLWDINTPGIRHRAAMLSLMVADLITCAEAIEVSFAMSSTPHGQEDAFSPLLVWDESLKGVPLAHAAVADLLIKIGDFCGGFKIDLGDVCEVVERILLPDDPEHKPSIYVGLIKILIALGKAMESERTHANTLSTASLQRGAPATVGWYLGVTFVLATRFAHDHLVCADIFAVADTKLVYNAMQTRNT